jgi:hypothetical protein
VCARSAQSLSWVAPALFKRAQESFAPTACATGARRNYLSLERSIVMNACAQDALHPSQPLRAHTNPAMPSTAANAFVPSVLRQCMANLTPNKLHQELTAQTVVVPTAALHWQTLAMLVPPMVPLMCASSAFVDDATRFSLKKTNG